MAVHRSLAALRSAVDSVLGRRGLSNRPKSLLLPSVEYLEERRLLARAIGIDVSHYQGTVNWSSAAAAGKQFTYIKSTEGNTLTDADLSANMSTTTGAKANGLLVGVYHHATPATTANDALNEANYFVQVAGSFMTAGYLRPAVDISQGSGIGKAAMSSWVNTFCSRVQTLTGIDPIVYANNDYVTTYFDNTVAQNHKLWISRWSNAYGNPLTTGSPPTGVWGTNSKTWDVWQYSNTGTVPGISGAVDLDVLPGDLSQLQSLIIGPAYVLSGNASIAEGSPYTLNLYPTNLGSRVLSSWSINWGDGTAAQTVAATAASVTHSFSDGPATFKISATATDDTGTRGSADKVTVAIANVAPTVAPVTFGSLVDGAAFQVKVATFTDPALGTTENYTSTINWGDGTTSSATSITLIRGSGSTPTRGSIFAGHQYPAGSGNHQITVTVTDSNGGSGSITETIVPHPAPTPYTIPGATGSMTAVSFTVQSRPYSAIYHNELGLYYVDDDQFDIGSVHPSDPGYADAAINITQLVLPRDRSDTDSTSTYSFVLPAGKRVAFVMVQDATIENYKTHTLPSDYSTDPNWPHNNLTPGVPNVFFDHVLANFDGYQHVLRSVGDDGADTYAFEDITGGGDQDFNDLVYAVSAEPAPTLTATADGPNQKIHLSWTDVSAEQGFRIFRGTSPNNMQALSDTLAHVLSFNDTTATSGVTYYYSVAALSSGNLPSDRSAVVSATLPESTPTLYATGIAVGTIALKWTPPSTNASYGYKIYRSESSGFVPSTANQIGSISGGATEYLDRGITVGRTFHYIVIAVDTIGHLSGPSNEASAVAINQDTDIDNDGVANPDDSDNDNDGIDDVDDLDDDNDGVPDLQDSDDGDADNDGVADWNDDDNDNDGIPDDADDDNDNDGIPDLTDSDDNNNGVPDADEPTDPDNDNDGTVDSDDPDDDNDGTADTDDPDDDNDGQSDGIDPSDGDNGSGTDDRDRTFIGFDELARGVTVSTQYPGVTFSSGGGDVVRVDNYYTWSNSHPNYIITGPAAGGLDGVGNVNLHFDVPVNDLSFWVYGDNAAGTTGTVTVSYGDSQTKVIPIITDGDFYGTGELIDLAGVRKISNVLIGSVTDPAGFAYDDFSYQQPQIKVAWKAINTATQKTELDTNPHLNGGQRIFPDKDSPTDTVVHDLIEVEATIPGAAAGTTVYFQSYDVDDPNSFVAGQPADEQIDKNDTASTKNGLDNRGQTPGQRGTFPSVGINYRGTAVTDAQGKAKIIFQVTQQPGDNFRVGASLSGAELDKINDNTVTPDNKPSKNFIGGLTDMLTVWRRLWIERDVMTSAPSSANSEVVNLRSVTSNVTLPAAFGTYDQIIVGVSQIDNQDEYEGGYLDIAGFGLHLPVYKNVDGFGNMTITVPGGSFNTAQLTTIAAGGVSGTLTDDDDLTRATVKADGGTLLSSAFGTAYIKPIYADQFNAHPTIDFRTHSEDDLSYASTSRDLTSEQQFWSTLLVSAHENYDYTDGDSDPFYAMGKPIPDFPADRSLDYGYSGRGLGFDSNVSLIFRETIYDILSQAGTSATTDEQHTVIHEIGHTAGSGLNGHNYNGIMMANAPKTQSQFDNTGLDWFRSVISW